MRRAAKVDTNQKKIVEQIRAIGGCVLHTHQLKNAFDILVGYNSNLYMIEIKSSKTSKLTGGELDCKNMFEAVGVPYYVIYDFLDFIDIIHYTK